MTQEQMILVYRYLYYVLGEPAVSEAVYDQLEREARAVLPEDSVVHKVGSSNPWDYSDKVKQYAKGLRSRSQAQ